MSINAPTHQPIYQLTHPPLTVARRLLVNENLDSGSMLPFIARAQAENYAVLLFNGNDNASPKVNTCAMCVCVHVHDCGGRGGCGAVGTRWSTACMCGTTSSAHARQPTSPLSHIALEASSQPPLLWSVYVPVHYDCLPYIFVIHLFFYAFVSFLIAFNNAYTPTCLNEHLCIHCSSSVSSTSSPSECLALL
jgi:hypothetical protein